MQAEPLTSLLVLCELGSESISVVKVGRLLFFQRIHQLEFELRQVQASVSTQVLRNLNAFHWLRSLINIFLTMPYFVTNS